MGTQGAKMKKPFIVLVLVVLGALALVVYRLRCATAGNEWSDARIRTLATMSLLASMCTETDLSSQPEDVTDIFTACNLRGLLLPSDWVIVFDEGHVLDEWGHPIRLRRLARGSEAWAFVSDGPNGVSEGGKGDDVVHVFSCPAVRDTD